MLKFYYMVKILAFSKGMLLYIGKMIKLILGKGNKKKNKNLNWRKHNLDYLFNLWVPTVILVLQNNQVWCPLSCIHAFKTSLLSTNKYWWSTIYGYRLSMMNMVVKNYTHSIHHFTKPDTLFSKHLKIIYKKHIYDKLVKAAGKYIRPFTLFQYSVFIG